MHIKSLILAVSLLYSPISISNDICPMLKETHKTVLKNKKLYTTTSLIRNFDREFFNKAIDSPFVESDMKLIYFIQSIYVDLTILEHLVKGEVSKGKVPSELLQLLPTNCFKEIIVQRYQDTS